MPTILRSGEDGAVERPTVRASLRAVAWRLATLRQTRETGGADDRPAGWRVALNAGFGNRRRAPFSDEISRFAMGDSHRRPPLRRSVARKSRSDPKVVVAPAVNRFPRPYRDFAWHFPAHFTGFACDCGRRAGHSGDLRIWRPLSRKAGSGAIGGAAGWLRHGCF
jgi:hypothetical protein